MEQHRRKIVLVTGLHMCGHERVSAFLHQERGYSVLWPGQDVAVAGGDEIYRRANANLELIRLHEDLLWDSHGSWIDFKFPRYHNEPYPGPNEYLAKFPAHVNILLTDPRAMLFMDMWVDRITHLIFIDREILETCEYLEKAYGPDSWPHYNRLDWEKTCRAYLERFEPYKAGAITIPFKSLWAPVTLKRRLDEVLGHDNPLTSMGSKDLCYNEAGSQHERDVVNDTNRTNASAAARQDGSRQVIPVTGEVEASYLRTLPHGPG